jgi:hypothetical protein
MKHAVHNARNHPTRGWQAFLCVLLGAGLPAFGLAGQIDQVDQVDPIVELRQEIADLKHSYQERIEALERRLDRLDGSAKASVESVDPIDSKEQHLDLEGLRRAAQAAVTRSSDSSTARVDPTFGDSRPDSGRERNLNRLNPEVSFTGVFLASGGDSSREEFRTQEFELDLQSALDPFSRTRWTLAFGEEGIEVEEGYVKYNSLPGSLDLVAGRFRQRFGPLNQQHLHALPQTDYPLAYQIFFGEEGLAQTGISLTWLPPNPWASANEVVLEITDGDNEVAFGGEDFEDLAILARLKNYWDLSDSTYFEWGLSGIAGEAANGGDSRVWGTDFTFQWRPPERAKYREVTWRSEVLLSQKDDTFGEQQEAWGAYSYIEGLLARNLYAGVRIDRVDQIDSLDQIDEAGGRLWGVSPYVSFWQSEFVRLRAEYGYLKNDFTKESSNRFTLQLTWAAGPHKHETY